MKAEVNWNSDEENHHNKDGENANNNDDNHSIAANSSEGQSKPKRKMKTSFQLEVLEKAYALDAYPSETMRAELSERLNLTDRQLRTWFCHRRLKDKKDDKKEEKKEIPSNRKRKATHLSASPIEDMRGNIPEPGSDYGSGSGSYPFTDPRKIVSDEVPLNRRYYESSPQSVVELRAIACVEAQLGEAIREDGPILGMKFDPLPPDAFGKPAWHISPPNKKEHEFSLPQRDDSYLLRHDSSMNDKISVRISSHPFMGSENTESFSKIQNETDVLMEKTCRASNMIEEVRTAIDFECNEYHISKELEKRRKNEERLKKEMERLSREKRKEEERLMRERQREEERLLRKKERELQRREKFLQKEHLRAEKMRQKEELRREREAVKRQVAFEKATARRIAKESLDLIEDEQLELMELAAASKELVSIAHLNYDALQSLESFRGSLSVLPPESVQLKRPFTIRPWMDSEGNIGSLLMVWRFLITFADVLGLWPFTLDEFVQAFHDYDSRLLGEVHVSLLRLIIKDIEIVARMPSTGLGTNQYSPANSEGGHTQIVEGAYLWGFDICNWQQHLNPLTWPEIFRQLALSAGCGPRLKKKNSSQTSLGDITEVKDCENAISTLRNGSAAENAFALMRERGLLAPRRSRHRLTPGTVKFAAFHVLSLEGSKGLTVLELADKIQKSGLRDLTTSKTPEASISVALTRDQKLFERIAPSTYCVRAAYRNDPADAEAILSAARKKIRIFENGLLGGDDAEDVERDEESEGNVDEDPEVDDMGAPFSAKKSVDHSNEANTYSGSEKDNLSSGISLIEKNESVENPSSVPLNGLKDAKMPSFIEQYQAQEDVGADIADQHVEIDESQSGESWIQGLAEGDYVHLSVEERLNALVTLVGIANEGNTIRSVLEDRLEAASALKKQMWAEGQSDKCRLKEDIMSKLELSAFIGGSAEVAGIAVGGSRSPLCLIDRKSKEASPSTVEDQNVLHASEDVGSEKQVIVLDLFSNAKNLLNQQHGYASKRNRSQLKAYISHIAEETYVYRSLPLGQDRRWNRYWQFVASASGNDPCSGRIFVELHDGNWRLIDSEEAFDALLSSLDTRGIRESHLHIMLQRIEKSFKFNSRRSLHSQATAGWEACESEFGSNYLPRIGSPSSIVCGSNSDTSDTRSFFRIELGSNEMERESALRRYQDFQKWMWKECFNSSRLCAMKYGKRRCIQLLTTCDSCFDSYLSEDIHCISCHQTFSASDKSFNIFEHEFQCNDKMKADPGVGDSSLPPRIRLLKALLSFIEVSVPVEAFELFWRETQRKTWATKLSMSSSTEELLQVLTVLEGAIKRDCLSATFEMTEEFLRGSFKLEGTLHCPDDLGSVPVLPWIPKTTAALALRLFDLDASIAYVEPEKSVHSEDKPIRLHMKLPSRYSRFKNKEIEVKERRQEYAKDRLTDMRSRSRSYTHGRLGSHDQEYGTKSQRKVHDFRFDDSRRNIRVIKRSDMGPRQQGGKGNEQVRGWGCQTVRKRKAEVMVAEDTLFKRSSNAADRSLRILTKEDQGDGNENVGADMDDIDNSSSAEAADVEAERVEQANWEQNFDRPSIRWNRNLTENDGDGNASGDDNVMGVEDSDENREINERSQKVANGAETDVGTDSEASDDYSE